MHSGMLGGDWEAEYEAMSEGDPAYLVQARRSTSRTSRVGSRCSIDAHGPDVPDRDRAMATFRRALGLGDDAAVGDKVRLTPEGIEPIDGVVDFLSPHFIGVRSDDAIYRFIYGFEGTTMVGHHLFAAGRGPTARPRRRGRPGSPACSAATATARDRLATSPTSSEVRWRRTIVPDRQRDRERNRVARLLKPHAPPDWEQRFRADRAARRRDRRRTHPDVRDGGRHPRVDDAHEGVDPVRAVRARSWTSS